LSGFIRQTSHYSTYTSSASWTILSTIEKRIKQKVECVGTPLKSWNININYGVKTGYNEAFIIDGAKREELIAADPKSAEIIRPVLRGRDVKRYGYAYADLWLISTFPSLKIDIENYPAVKQHLLTFGYDRLKQTGEAGARKKTTNKWFETQDSIGYWDDFNRQKIVWGNLNLQATYCFAEPGIYINAPCSMIVPADAYLLAFLNSKLADYYIRTLGVTRNGGYFEYKPMFVEKLPIPNLNEELKFQLNELVARILEKTKNNDDTTIENEIIEETIFDLYDFDIDEKKFIRAFKIN
jgi:adenine-specific DNA-methyltransferase